MVPVVFWRWRAWGSSPIIIVALTLKSNQLIKDIEMFTRNSYKIPEALEEVLHMNVDLEDP